MKALETLGRRHSGKSIFQYKRYSGGLIIRAVSKPPTTGLNEFRLSTSEWRAILRAIESQPTESFGLTNAGGVGQPALLLKTIMKNAVPTPSYGQLWNDSWFSYVFAILEHEGSMDVYTGPLGNQGSARIVLARNTKR